MNVTDLELLRKYARENSQDSFAEVVSRHINLVYSVALRLVRSNELAEEVAQSAFTDLAKNADRLTPDTILAAWLHQVARRTAIDVIRRETRRQLREKIATEMNAMNTPADEWSRIEPILDEAVEELEGADRAAVLLRYFEDKSLREVGLTLGISEDAAQKRVSRAVDRLRELIGKRGVTIGALGLVAAVSANAIQAAPSGLAAGISTAVVSAGTTIAATTATTTSTLTATKTIAMTTLQKAAVTIALAVSIGAAIYEARETEKVREQNSALQQAQSLFAAQLQQFQQERDDATNKLGLMGAELEAQRNDNKELLKLRGEVTRLRSGAQRNASSGETNDPTQAAAQSWMKRVSKLKEHLAQNPQTGIPELKLLTEEDWLAAVKDSNLESEYDYRKAMSLLRGTAEDKFGQSAFTALQKYTKANNGEFPKEMSQLQSYFDLPVDDGILSRWEIVPKSVVPNVGVGNTIITQAAPVDEILDQRMAIGANGRGSMDFLTSVTESAMKPVYSAFFNANPNYNYDGTDSSRFLPYATTPEQQAAVQKLIERDALKK
jgi:RNA polymerase sigma factor (sigma-70 family)